MSSKYSLVAAAVLAIASAPASAAFVGSYTASNWTQAVNTGVINISGAPNSVALTSSNAGNGANNTDFTIAATAAGSVSFNWSFVNGDTDGSSYDPFGWLLNGSFIQLSADNLFGTQSGTASFTVNANDVFGFRAHSIDSGFGASTTTISNFSAPDNKVPEPGSLALLGAGLAGLAALRKRKMA